MAKTYHSFEVLAAAAAAGVLVEVGMLVAVMLVGESAEAAFPGQNGKIAFESNRDGNNEIYTMNPNGQGVDPSPTMLLATFPPPGLRTGAR